MKLSIKQVAFPFFLVLVLFVTTKSFYIYYSLVFIGLVVFVIFPSLLVSAKSQKGILLPFILFLVGALYCYRMMYFSNLEDAKELLKFLIFILIIYFGVNANNKIIEQIFSIFVVVNFVVALCQYLGIYSFGMSNITAMYNADKHIEASLSYSAPRALGLSSGPGQQSMVGIFFFAYFLVLFYWETATFKRFLMIFLSLGCVLLSQSKTAFIALVVGGVYVGGLVLIFGGRKGYISSALFAVFAVVVILLSGYFFILFPEYARLIDQGGSVSSLSDRFLNWKDLIDPVLEENSLLFYLFGVGRSGLLYFGVSDLPFDSDYIYILVNFGLLGFLILLMAVIFFFVRGSLRFARADIHEKILIVILAYAVPSGLALNFIVEPRVYILMAIVISLYLQSLPCAKRIP